MSMQKKFEPHLRPNLSKLETWRSEITEMRSLKWPYTRIVAWLSIEQNFKISSEAVRQFCKVRSISKEQQFKTSRSQKKELIRPDSKGINSGQNPTKRKFHYDDSNPVPRWR